jgi:hypothetical protein
MSTKEVLDTHRLMYRNARIRALSLSDGTSPIQFVDITEDTGDGTEIGNIVYTNEMGYVYYGANHRLVACLGVKESAIIQVDLNGNNNWHDIEWIVRKNNDSQYVLVEDVRKVVDRDGNTVWNPLGPTDWVFGPYVTPDEIGKGKWAEGEMSVTEDMPADLEIDEWTHTITIQPGHGSDYVIKVGVGRAGQMITIVNNSDVAVTITEIHQGGSSAETISARGAILAVKSLSAQKWILRSFDSAEHIAGTFSVLEQLLSGTQPNVWILEALGKLNKNNTTAPGADGQPDLPPNTIALTYGNRILSVMAGDGIMVGATHMTSTYAGSGTWLLEQNSAHPANPARTAVIEIGSTIYPVANPFGSYSGTNDLYINLPMVAGERLHIVLAVSNQIDYAGGLSRDTKIYINKCRVYSATVNHIGVTPRLLSGWIERCFDGTNTWYFWNEDTTAEQL